MDENVIKKRGDLPICQVMRKRQAFYLEILKIHRLSFICFFAEYFVHCVNADILTCEKLQSSRFEFFFFFLFFLGEDFSPSEKTKMSLQNKIPCQNFASQSSFILKQKDKRIWNIFMEPLIS